MKRHIIANVWPVQRERIYQSCEAMVSINREQRDQSEAISYQQPYDLVFIYLYSGATFIIDKSLFRFFTFQQHCLMYTEPRPSSRGSLRSPCFSLSIFVCHKAQSQVYLEYDHVTKVLADSLRRKKQPDFRDGVALRDLLGS